MAHDASSDQISLKAEFNQHIISLNELACLLHLDDYFARLVQAHTPFNIPLKAKRFDPLHPHHAETLKFEPEKYEPGMDYRDFWLNIYVEGLKDPSPIMGMKFMDMNDGRFDMSSAFFTQIGESEVYYRPVLGYAAIDNIEKLIHDVIGKPLKMEFKI